MLEFVDSETARQAAADNTSAKNTEKQGDGCVRVKIRSPQKASSATCKNCECRDKRRRRNSAYGKLKSYLITGRNIEAKLKKFNVEPQQVSSPLTFLRRLLGILFQPDRDANFTHRELEELTDYQLARLKHSLLDAVFEKEKELGYEQFALTEEREQLKTLKEKAKELEVVAWEKLKPFVNKHPSLRDLTRVLMF